MNIITKDSTFELIVKNSKFITYLYKINSTDDAKEKLNDIKNKYKDAKHICYAYICNNNIKFSDDKEPSGTAGKTVLNVLEKNNLNYVIAIVIRYFGGIKLGIGGLSKAYRDSIINALNMTNVKEKEDILSIQLTFNINYTKNIDYLLKNININKEYKNNVTYKFIIKKKDYNLIENELKKYTINIEKEDIIN